MKYLVVLILMMSMTAAVAWTPPISQPKERTTLGEIYTYICEDIFSGRYHDDSGMWACTKE